MSLRDKRILITAGPTWVPLDSVRVIANTATGETGILPARKLAREGAKVTLLLGQGEACCSEKGIKVIRFKFFEELRGIFRALLLSGAYNAVIHSAAVSDYRPKEASRKKVPSGLKRWKVEFIPTVKLIDIVRRLDPDILLVGFKFQPHAALSGLIKEAKALLTRAKCDLVVANTADRSGYKAYLVSRGLILGPIRRKSGLAEKLADILAARL